MENEKSLFERIDDANNETPRTCQVLALVFAGQGKRIPEDIGRAVVSSAERNRDELKEIIDTINIVATPTLNSDILRANFLDLASKIAQSNGLDTPNAFQRRLDYLHQVLYGSVQDDTEGIGFTE
jgi:hypothetical protein